MPVAHLRLALAPPRAALTSRCAGIILTVFASASLLGQTLVGQISGIVRDGLPSAPIR
jgi:hypothetical protein